MLQITVSWQRSKTGTIDLTRTKRDRGCSNRSFAFIFGRTNLGTKYDINLLNLQFGRGYEDDSGVFSAVSGGGMGGGGGGDDEDWD